MTEHEILKLVQIGTWEVDLVASTLKWSDVTRMIHEVPKDYKPNLNDAIDFYKKGYSRDKIREVVSDAIEFGKSYDEVLQVVTSKQNEIWVRAKGRAIFDNGKCTRLIGTFQEITDEKELQETNKLNEIFISEAPNAIAMFDKNLIYIAASKKWYQDYNLVGQDIIGKSHYEIFPEIGDDWKQIHQECLAGAINTCDEAYFQRADGSEQWIMWDVRPWRNENGEVGGIIMLTDDITERKEVENLLAESEERFRGAFEHSAIGMALISPEGVWLKVNQQVCKIVGYSAKELLKKTFKDITHPDDLDLDLRYVEDMLAGKINTYQMEKRYFHKNGSIVWVRLSVSLVRDKKNKPLHFVSQIENITRRKKAEQELNKTIAELNAILNYTNVSVITTDLNGTITHFNNGAEKLLGYEAEEMIGKLNPSVIHVEEEVIQRGKDLSDQLGYEVSGFDVFVENARLGKPDAREWTYIKKDGTRFPVLLVVTAILEENGKISGFLGIATDLTEIKEAEKEIKRTSERLKLATAAADIGIWEYESSGKYFWDENMYKIFEADLNADPNEVWDRTIHPDDKVWVEKALSDTLRGKTNLDIEFRICKNDDSIKYLKADGATQYDANKIPVSIIGTIWDLTEEKEFDERKQQIALLESKSKEMEQFAYITSHDLREPLLSIKNYVSLLIDDFGDQVDEELRNYLLTIKRSVNRMEILIRSLLDYSRLSKPKKIELVDLDALVNEVCDDLNALITTNKAQIKFNNLPTVKGYPTELKLMFQNLISNSVKFKLEGKDPVITFDHKKVKKGWQISVNDNGIGIREEDQEKIFIIFRKLHKKEEYPGTGIGLAHVKKITEIHNGRVWVESEPGKGSTFYVTLLTENNELDKEA